MLACLAQHVEFHPMRLSGLRGSYRGHDGVREWFDALRRRHHEHRILLTDVRDLGRGHIVATGSLSLAGELDIGPYWAVHRVENGVIVAAHHYLTEPAMIEYLGLIP
jgi:hypothetical protein